MYKGVILSETSMVPKLLCAIFQILAIDSQGYLINSTSLCTFGQPYSYLVMIHFIYVASDAQMYSHAYILI